MNASDFPSAGTGDRLANVRELENVGMVIEDGVIVKGTQ